MVVHLNMHFETMDKNMLSLNFRTTVKYDLLLRPV